MWTKVRASARLKRPGYFSSIQVWFSTSEQDDGEATEVYLTFLQLRNGTRWCARNLFQVPEVWKRRRLLEINKRRRCCLIFFKGNSLLSIWDGRVSIKNWLKNLWSSKFSFLIILVHKYRIYIYLWRYSCISWLRMVYLQMHCTLLVASQDQDAWQTLSNLWLLKLTWFCWAHA